MAHSRASATTTVRTTVTIGRPRLGREIDTVLVKTASRCNLDCSYCYVYHLGDDEWARQPKRMPSGVLLAVIEQLGLLSHSQRRAISVVMHGGEPLLLGIKKMTELVQGLRSSLRPDAGIHVQTNGVLLTDDFLDLFGRNDVGVSISLDGPAEVHDRNRVDHRGHGSYERVMQAVERIQLHEDGPRLFSGVLAVVDPTSDPIAVYDSLKATGAPGFDLLYRDGNYDVLPYGKASQASTEYGDWMVRLVDHYLADPSPPRVRVIDDLVRLILGGVPQKEGVGLEGYDVLVIDTDGSITRNDTLKGANPGADRFAAAPSIGNPGLIEFLHTPEYAAYAQTQLPSSAACKNCPELTVCGGGMPAHRYSELNGYTNPTIYCVDQLLLISHLRRQINALTTDGARE